MATRKLHRKDKPVLRSKSVSVKKNTEETPWQSQRKAGRLRAFPLGEGLPKITGMLEEMQDMEDVLLGRVAPPINNGPMTLMVIADAYYARASELTRLILTKEREGHIDKGSPYYKFRTGELRTFMEMAKRAADLGSRILTAEQLTFDQARYGRESYGD